LHVPPPEFVSRKKHIIQSYLKWVSFRIHTTKVPSSFLSSLWVVSWFVFQCVLFLVTMFGKGRVILVLFCWVCFWVPYVW
jgi:hypothetical protein